MAHEVVERNGARRAPRRRSVCRPAASPSPSAWRTTSATIDGRHRRPSGPRRRLLPRRPATRRPVPEASPTVIPVDLDGPDRGARRRRPVHGPHGARRAQRAVASGVGPARSSSPSWSTGATASCRSDPTSSARTSRRRRDEAIVRHPRGRRGSGRGAARDRLARAARTSSTLDDLSRDGDRRGPRRRRELRRGQPARRAEGARAQGSRRRLAVLRGVDADAAELRDRGQAAERRRPVPRGRVEQREEGRVAARHHRDHRRARHRRGRRCATSLERRRRSR